MVYASPSTVQFPSVSRKAVNTPQNTTKKGQFLFHYNNVLVSSATYIRSCAIPGNTGRPPPPMVVVKTMCLGLFGMPPWNGRLPTVVTEQNL